MGKKKLALITGVTGMDGSHLSDFLLEKGYRVVGVKRRTSTDNTWRVAHLRDHDDFSIIEGDITDYYCMYNIINKWKPAEVYSLAAQSHVGTSFQQPQLTWDVTAQGCMNVLQALVEVAKPHQIYRPRFYNAATSELFGSNYTEQIVAVIGGTYKCQTENTPFSPNSPYGIAKQAMFEFTRMCKEAYDIYACSGILFNHTSERRGENFIVRKITKWIGEFKKKYSDIPKTIKDRELLPLGNIKAVRDFGYAPDYVEAMWMMLQQEKPDDFVICTGQSYSIEEVLIKAFAAIGINDYSPYIVIDPQFFRDREVEFLRGSYDKAKEKLGWKPETSFDEIVGKMVNADIERNK